MYFILALSIVFLILALLFLFAMIIQIYDYGIYALHLYRFVAAWIFIFGFLFWGLLKKYKKIKLNKLREYHKKIGFCINCDEKPIYKYEKNTELLCVDCYYDSINNPNYQSLIKSKNKLKRVEGVKNFMKSLFSIKAGLWTCVTIIVFMLLFPPWKVSYEHRRDQNNSQSGSETKYSFIFSPPTITAEEVRRRHNLSSGEVRLNRLNQNSSINFGVLIVQITPFAIAGAFLYKKSKD